MTLKELHLLYWVSTFTLTLSLNSQSALLCCIILLKVGECVSHQHRRCWWNIYESCREKRNIFSLALLPPLPLWVNWPNSSWRTSVRFGSSSWVDLSCYWPWGSARGTWIIPFHVAPMTSARWLHRLKFHCSGGGQGGLIEEGRITFNFYTKNTLVSRVRKEINESYNDFEKFYMAHCQLKIFSNMTCRVFLVT